MSDAVCGKLLPDCKFEDLLSEDDVDFTVSNLPDHWSIDSRNGSEMDVSLIRMSSTDGYQLDFSQVLDRITNCLDKRDKLKNEASNNNNILIEKKEITTPKKTRLKKGQRYTASFKRKVLDYSVKHTFKDTAKKFNVNCNTVTEWAREYKRLLQLKKSTTVRPGSKQKTDVINHPANLIKTDLEKQSASGRFVQWLKEVRSGGRLVGREEVLAAALAALSTYTSNSANDWFCHWVHRLNSSSNPTNASSDIKHIFYPENFKLEVALYAKEYTKLKAAHVFGVSSRRVYQWCSLDTSSVTVTQIKHQVESKLKTWYEQRLAAGIKPKGQEIMTEARNLYSANGMSHIKCSKGWLEKLIKRLDVKMVHVQDDELLMWILEQMDDNQPLSVAAVTHKAQQLAVQNNIHHFKGSKGWTLRFLKRHSPLLQCWSARLDLMPPVAMSQSTSFCRVLQERICAAALPPDCIGCMDEIPISFTLPSEKVQTPRLLRQTSLRCCLAVICLAATSDGRLLPPALVFKGSNAKQMIYQGIIPVFYQQDGTVDAQVLKEWFRHVWMRLVRRPSIMVVDSYGPHQSEQFRQHVSAANCHLAIIPPGCAIHLQPCAFNLSRRFQEVLQEEWSEDPRWSGGGASVASSSSSTARTAPNENAVLEWTLKAYNTLREDKTSISSSFLLTGLTATNRLEQVSACNL